MVDNIGKKIRELRKANKISQEKLAEELDISIQQMHKYETGKNKISIDKLVILAEKFNVDLNYFAYDKTSDKENIFLPLLTPDEKKVIEIYRNIEIKNLRKSWLVIGTEIVKCLNKYQSQE